MKARMLWQVVAAGFVLSTTAGCWPLAVGGAALGGWYVGNDDRSAVRIADDAAITASVKTKYIRDEMVKALDVNVDTYDGIVTIYGTLPDRPAEQRAVALAEETNGVRRVVSKVTVVSDYSYSNNSGYSGGSDNGYNQGGYNSGAGSNTGGSYDNGTGYDDSGYQTYPDYGSQNQQRQSQTSQTRWEDL